MARTLKIDNGVLKRFGTQKKKKSRQLRSYFLIVCEGKKTEPNYFRGFPKQTGNIIYDIQFQGGGISTLKVVETAIELRKNSKRKYDRVWAVFDKDNFKSNAFNSAILKGKAHDIHCAWSNEAFELWYLLHFHNRVTAMNREDYQKAIEAAINNKLPKNASKFKYEKNRADMYIMLEKFGNRQQAIKWAKMLDGAISGEAFASYNPVTQVYKLVEELLGQSEELNREIMAKHEEGY